MTDSSASTVLYSVEGNIASIALNRPHSLNAVIPQLVRDLHDALQRAVAERVSAAIIRGEGKAFCAGFDLKYDRSQRTELGHRRELDVLQEVTRLIRRADFPVITAVHGYALGNGCEFALAGDLVVAAEGTQFGFPEVSWGLSVTGGISSLLTQAVGPYRAKELILLGDRFTAEQAHAWGLVNQVTSEQNLIPLARKLATELAGLPLSAIVRAKRVIDAVSSGSLEAALALEVEHALVAGKSEETRSQVSKFVAEREAKETG